MPRVALTRDKSEKEIIIAGKLRGPGPAKYKLPGSTGYKNHDGTKKKMPSFSFGKRFCVNVSLKLMLFLYVCIFFIYPFEKEFW